MLLEQLDKVHKDLQSLQSLEKNLSLIDKIYYLLLEKT